MRRLQQRAGAGVNVPTPFTADGKIDFSGMWVGSVNSDLKPDPPGNVTILAAAAPAISGRSARPRSISSAFCPALDRTIAMRLTGSSS